MTGRRNAPQVWRLGGCPNIHSTIAIPGRSIHRFHGGMSQVGLLVLGLYHLFCTLGCLFYVSLTALFGPGVFAGCLSVTFKNSFRIGVQRVGDVPLYSQFLLGLSCLPVALGNQ